jgi:hypothetical protein
MPGETIQRAKGVKQIAEHTTIGSPACPRRMEQVKIGDGAVVPGGTQSAPLRFHA